LLPKENPVTTLAKVAANRANAQLSTGPRTAAGKAASARNAVRHGLLSAAPVVAGEDPVAWERHRAEVSASLGPVGAMEQQLAARAALLLWRLARVARFEAATVSAGLDAALLPRPPADDPLGAFRATREEAPRKGLAKARREATAARKAAGRLKPQLEYLAALPGRPDDEAVPAEVAVGVLDAAYQVLFNYELSGDPPVVEGKAFLAKLGRSEKTAGRVPWTAGLVRRGLAVYAALAEEPADWLAAEAHKQLSAEVRRQARTRRQRERLAAGLAERGRRQAVWRAADELIPRPGVDDRVARYEAHLSRQLSATLRELERLQALRAGRPALPAADAAVAAGPAG
jgi:hypothetical protein